MTIKIHPSWYVILNSEFKKPYWHKLTTFLKSEYSQKECFPEEQSIFRAFEITPFDRVRVVILGQDPYHTPGAAMGFSFAIPNGSKIQPSLRNIFKELESDMDIKRSHTDLTDWAEQGVLLLNTVLTVRSGEPASHSEQGWEHFTNTIIQTLSEKQEGIVFILWGNSASSKLSLINQENHHIIMSPHPSPFSAHRGFFGSRPFSRTNQYLQQGGKNGIIWG